MINILDDMVIGVVAHDAGAAAQIAHYIQPLQNKILFSLRGPAIDIFRSLLGEVHVMDQYSYTHSEYPNGGQTARSCPQKYRHSL